MEITAQQFWDCTISPSSKTYSHPSLLGLIAASILQLWSVACRIFSLRRDLPAGEWAKAANISAPETSDTADLPGNLKSKQHSLGFIFSWSWFTRLEEVLISSCSVTQSCPSLCDLMDCSTPGFPVHHQLPEITQTHVHRVGDAIQPSHRLSSPSPPAFNLSQHQGLF